MVHIFIFRHCLRSTKSTVNLHEGEGKQRMEFFFKTTKEPVWNTPKEWCTEEGVAILEQTGAWLAQQVLSLHSIKDVRIISDTSQRDVDSALSLAKGLSDDGNGITSTIELNPNLFHLTNYSAGPVCNPVDDSILAEQIQKRLDSIPQPVDSLQDTLEIVNLLAQFRLKHPFPDANSIKLNATKLTLKGPINLVKTFAQMLFYSRASNLAFPSLQADPTTDQLHQLVQWIGWRRAILFIGNSLAAQRGAILMNFLLQNLDSKHKQEQQAIILFGHDSSLDSLATALNVSWTLPFYGNFSPTPPGSAMHFYGNNEKDGAGVHVDLLYPTYFTKNGAIDSTGVLETLPLLSFRSMRDFRQHPLDQLGQYPGAMECFETAASNGDKGGDYVILGISLLVVMAMVVLYGRKMIRGKQCFRDIPQQVYINIPVQIELT